MQEQCTLLYNTATRATNPVNTKKTPPFSTLAAPLLVPVDAGELAAPLPVVGTDELLPTTTTLTTPVAAAVPNTLPAAAHGVRVNVFPLKV
jgi:hypothetical protein